MRNIKYFIIGIIIQSVFFIGCAPTKQSVMTERVVKEPESPCQHVEPFEARKKLSELGLSFSGENFNKSAFEGDIVATCLFLSAGMNINNSTFAGGTALIAASKQNQVDIVKLLLSKGADPNIVIAKDARVSWQYLNVAGFSALMFAARTGNEELVKMLLDAGADVNLGSTDGQTAVSVAKKFEHEDLIPLLKPSMEK